jgi:NAD(P)-dependent dehydrogenase (short-subunit alcohol dehydrogenase family)
VSQEATIANLSSLRGRRVLITGAAGHLGAVFADTVAELGATVLLVDRPGTGMEALAEALSRKWRVAVECRACDLESGAQRDALIADTRAAGPLNVLINNAAFVGTSDLQGWGVPFLEQSVETWRRAIEVNLTAVFHLCQGLSSSMTGASGASIINVGSIYGEVGPDWSLYAGTSMSNPAAYGASKGGVIQLTRWLATTLAPKVRVNAISPGGIFRNQAPEFVRRYAQRTPLGRMATEQDFRGVVAFLASDMSGYVTGQNMMIDGGWGVW